MTRWTVLFLSSLILCMSCSPTERVIYKYKDVDYVHQIVIEKTTLEKLMNECIDIKVQLLDCLERERK